MGFSQAGTGGGIGAIPFAIRSDNDQPAIFATIAARDTYYTANPDDLTDIDNKDLAVGIGTLSNVTSAFIYRSGESPVWQPIATNFRGTQGDKGDKGDKGDRGDQGQRGLPGRQPTDDEIRQAIGATVGTGQNNIWLGHTIQDAIDAATGGGTFRAPVITSFVARGISRNITPQTLSGNQIFDFAVARPANVSAAGLTLTQSINGAASTTLQSNISATATSVTVAINVPLAAGQHVEWTLEGTDTNPNGGETFNAKYRVDAAALSEQLYYGQQTDNTLANFDHTTLSGIPAETGDHTVTIGPLVTGSYVVFAAPADHPITDIVNVLGVSELTVYPSAGTTDIGGVTYTVRYSNHANVAAVSGQNIQYVVRES